MRPRSGPRRLLEPGPTFALVLVPFGEEPGCLGQAAPTFHEELDLEEPESRVEFQPWAQAAELLAPVIGIVADTLCEAQRATFGEISTCFLSDLARGLQFAVLRAFLPELVRLQYPISCNGLGS